MRNILFLIAACAYGQQAIVGGLNVSGAINGGTSAAGTDAYAITTTAVTGKQVKAYVTTQCFTFKADVANSGAASLAVDGLAATAIKKAEGGVTTDLADNEIRVGQTVTVCYDGTNFQMQSRSGVAPAGGSTMTTVANASLYMPFGSYAYATNTGAITANTVYVYQVTTPHFTEGVYAKLCAGFSSAAASGKYLAVGLYSKATNNDLTLIAGTRFLADSTVAAANGGICGTADHGAGVSGGLYTIGARADISFAMCSDGAPALISQGSSVAAAIQEFNGSSYLQKRTITSTGNPCTGTGSGLTLPTTITNANQTAGALVVPLLFATR